MFRMTFAKIAKIHQAKRIFGIRFTSGPLFLDGRLDVGPIIGHISYDPRLWNKAIDGCQVLSPQILYHEEFPEQTTIIIYDLYNLESAIKKLQAVPTPDEQLQIKVQLIVNSFQTFAAKGYNIIDGYMYYVYTFFFNLIGRDDFSRVIQNNQSLSELEVEELLCLLLKAKYTSVFCRSLFGARIGHLALNTEMYFCRLSKLEEGDRLNLFFCGIGNLCNRTLLDMIKRRISVIEGDYIVPSYIARVLSRSGDFWNKGNNPTTPFPIVAWEDDASADFYMYSYWRDAPATPSLNFTREELEKGHQLLETMLVPKSSEYVCFQNRSPEYLEHLYHGGHPIHNYRDCKISNYMLATLALSQKGIYCFRMGAIIDEPLPEKEAKIIDYASCARSEFGDIFLSATCKFFLGNTAGLATIPLVFRRPIALANVAPITELGAYTEQDIIIPKKIWHKRQQRFLSLFEMFSFLSDERKARILSTAEYEARGLVVVENSEEDIFYLAIEMNDRIDGTWIETVEDKLLQEQLCSVAYSVYGRKTFNCRFGTYFLRRNKELLDIIRHNCVVCEHNHLEDLHMIESFPVFMGCVDQPTNNDVFMDMDWAICSNCGCIQLRKLVPLNLVYLENHNEAIGKRWSEHHRQFARFILKHGGKNRIEIGGAQGMVAKFAREEDVSGRWLIIEPNPIGCETINNTEFYQGWFDEQFVAPFQIDTIIHSNVMEHWYNPRANIKHMEKLLSLGGRIVFAIPNMETILRWKYTNCLNFEHTYYLDYQICEYMLSLHGFKIVAMENFENYAMFIACEKIGGNIHLPIPNKYEMNRHLFQDFVAHHVTMVKDISKKVSEWSGPAYLFGAHIFTQYLLGFGLDEEQFVCVLDNGPIKIGKRLYGTNLITQSPQCLADIKDALVILKAGMYNEEIKKDIVSNINPFVTFYE